MRDEDVLTPCGQDIRKEAASGVDHVRAHADEQHVDDNLHPRGERLQPQRDRANRVRRHAMPNGAGTPPPRGLPAGEDPRRQRAVARLLAALYAQDCLRWSSGSRPPGGALAAVDTLTINRPVGPDAWVVEADLTKFVATLDPAGRVRLVAARMDAGALRRLLQKGLKAGGLDTDGQGLHPVTGTPQGGPGSPSLAQVSRPSVWGLWVEQVGKQPWSGAAGRSRYAAAGVGAFEGHAAAERVSNGLGPRREPFGLALAAAKPRTLPCRRDRAAGRTSVEGLGFEGRGGKARTGKEHLTRRPARKTLRPSPNRVTAWGNAPRHRRRPGRFPRLHATRRGDDNDDGVPGKAARRQAFCHTARRRWRKGLNRRRPRHSDTWPGATAGLERVHVGPPPERWPPHDAAGHPQDLSRPAAASRAEAPGARHPHAGIGAGAVGSPAVLPR
jgi:RNA-directed DNA polymerase